MVDTAYLIAGLDLALGADLCSAIDELTLPPPVQAAIVHAQFEAIHPHEDGDGRTGRALVQVVLRRRGLSPSFVPPISVVLARHRDAYITGLTAYRHGDLAGWVQRFSGAAGPQAGIPRPRRGASAAGAVA